jgi:hypothetical protein
MSGGHSRLDALNRPYANADVSGDLPYAPIPARKGMLNLAFGFSVYPLAPQYLTLGL